MSPRPATLREIAAHSDSLETFGRLFRDWLHELRRHSSRPALAGAIRDEPFLLAPLFPEGAVADAWLAAYAEYLAGRIGQPVPGWSRAPSRILSEPWFASPQASPARRLAALRDSPPPFKNRNLFTETVDLPIALRAGRPRKSAADLLRNNTERQRRFRARRALELELLRTAVQTC